MKTTTHSEEDSRVRLIAPGFWEDDLAQIAELSRQGGQRYQVPYLRRQALFLGVKTLSASLLPRHHRQSRLRGLYNDQDLAGELQPLLASPVQFCERHGFSVITPPASLVAVTKAVLGGEFDKGVISPEHFLDAFKQRETGIGTAKGEEAKGQYWIEDLEQIEALAEQQGREHPAFLRKAAFRLGTLLLTASGPAQGPYGLYQTGEQVAGTLAPLLLPAILFLEERGYSVLPMPAIVSTLLELIMKLTNGTSFVPSRDINITEVGESDRQEELSRKTPTASKRAVVSKRKREQMDLENDGSL